MALSTIEVSKETGLVQINVVPRPLILCSSVVAGGDALYLTTTPNLGGNDLTYNGNDYQARLQSNVIEQIQAQSPQGYDIPGSITLKIADGDGSIWLDHCMAVGGALQRGRTLTVLFVLWDVPTNSYTTNAYSWTFILDKASVDAAGIITVKAQARQSMTRLSVPNFARQNRCGMTFPPDQASRIDGLQNPTSVYYGCGYSPDVGGVGNTTTANLTNPDGSQLTDASGLYVMCDLTRSCGPGKGTLTQGCMARLGNYSATGNYPGTSTPIAPDGDIIDDESNRRTGHFTGDTWVSPVGWAGHEYVNPSGGKIYGFNTPNPATGQTYYNQGYGTQWVTATVLAPAGDPNSNRCEFIVCMAPVGPAIVKLVLVGGVQIPENNAADQLFTYRILSSGGRSSTISVDSIYDGHGDPHGSMCWGETVVPTELSQAGSIPQVQVLVQFPQCLHALPIASAAPDGSGNTVVSLPAGVTNIDVTAATNVYVKGNSGIPDGEYALLSVGSGSITIGAAYGSFTGTGGGIFYFPLNAADAAMVDATGAVAANPVWALMDLVAMWGPFTLADFDVQTWYDAAQECAEQISYIDLNGNSATHARYRCSLKLDGGSRQTLAKAVLGIRNCAGLILGRNAANGLLQCFVEETLADQQPLPIPGSNTTVPIASFTAAGNATLTAGINSSVTTVPLSYGMRLVANQIIQIDSEQMQVVSGENTTSLTVTRAFGGTTAASHSSVAAVQPCGYPAYSFDGNGSIELGTFEVYAARSLNDTPNTVSFPFQDSANQWVSDSITTVDDFGYISSGDQEIQAPFQVLGIENFDQGTRRSNITLAQGLYGNIRFDSGGTEFMKFRSTVKAAHLASRPGSLCLVTYQQRGF